MANRQQLIEKAREYLGTPFHHQGRLKGVGVDCIGLVACVGRDLGLAWADRDRTDYGIRGPAGAFEGAFFDVFPRIAIAEALPGDLLGFWIDSAQRPTHIAIKTDVGIIHAHQFVNAVTENGIGYAWRHRLSFACRMVGLED